MNEITLACGTTSRQFRTVNGKIESRMLKFDYPWHLMSYTDALDKVKKDYPGGLDFFHQAITPFVVADGVSTAQQQEITELKRQVTLLTAQAIEEADKNRWRINEIESQSKTIADLKERLKGSEATNSVWGVTIERLDRQIIDLKYDLKQVVETNENQGNLLESLYGQIDELCDRSPVGRGSAYRRRAFSGGI